MPHQILRDPQIWLAASVALLAAAALLNARQVRRRLDRLDVEGLSRRVADLGREAEGQAREIEAGRRECAEAKIRLAAAEDELSRVKEESARFLGIFKTVLYGFDYIVQGCKSALEISPGGKEPGEKRITAD